MVVFFISPVGGDEEDSIDRGWGSGIVGSRDVDHECFDWIDDDERVWFLCV